ncbi:hypothetical protein AVEN_215288-1, partial [Araneus ventricosus]
MAEMWLLGGVDHKRDEKINKNVARSGEGREQLRQFYQGRRITSYGPDLEHIFNWVQKSKLGTS